MEYDNRLLEYLNLSKCKKYKTKFILTRLILRCDEVRLGGYRIKYKLPSSLETYISWNNIYPDNLDKKTYVQFWHNAHKYGLSKSTIFLILRKLIVNNDNIYKNYGRDIKQVYI